MRKGDGEFLKEMLNPIELRSSGCNSLVFSLSGGMSNGVLLIHAPIDGIRA